MIKQILFGLIASTILIGMSYFSSKIYSVSFRFVGVTQKASFFVFLLIPLLFIASVLTRHTTTWGIGPKTYTIIQVVAGIGLYLVLGAVVLSIFLLVTWLSNTTLPVIIPLLVVSLVFFLSGLGIYQAKKIVVAKYTVTLQGAPASWNGKTAVLVTDTHFGLVNQQKFSNKVIQKILSLRPDFVLHAGDFYDGPMIDTAPITASWKQLTAVAPVFYTPGNHEMYGDYAVFLRSIADAGVTVLDNKKTMYDGVQIAGITYHDGKDNGEAAQAIADLRIDARTPSILINHPPTSLAAANDASVDLMVSGHTHNGQFWPANYLIKWIYGVYGYGLNDYKALQVLTSKGVGTFGPPMRLFNTAEIVQITFSTK